MRTHLLVLAALALTCGTPRPTCSLDDSFSGVLKQVRPQNRATVGDLGWLKWVAGGAVVLLALAGLVGRLRQGSQPARPQGRRLSPRQARRGFSEQAAALGLRLGEGRLLGKIALRLAPQHPVALLTTPTGREHLIADLDKRINRRGRELEALQGLRERLCQMRGHELHARESLRVETDLPVWISRKLQVVPTAGDEDGVLDEAAPVGGHLVDLSEGGAAMRADEAFGRGDVLEVWSADANTPLPPMAAAVVDVQDDGEEGGPLLHLHFIDPPTIELVELHRELQAEAQASAAEPEAGTAPAAPRRSDQMA